MTTVRFETVERADIGTEYTLGILRVDPGRHPAVETEGYESPFTLFVWLSDGQVRADHDPHRLARDVGDRWITEELAQIEAAVLDELDRDD